MLTASCTGRRCLHARSDVRGLELHGMVVSVVDAVLVPLRGSAGGAALIAHAPSAGMLLAPCPTVDCSDIAVNATIILDYDFLLGAWPEADDMVVAAAKHSSAGAIIDLIRCHIASQCQHRNKLLSLTVHGNLSSVARALRPIHSGEQQQQAPPPPAMAFLLPLSSGSASVAVCVDPQCDVVLSHELPHSAAVRHWQGGRTPAGSVVVASCVPEEGEVEVVHLSPNASAASGLAAVHFRGGHCTRTWGVWTDGPLRVRVLVQYEVEGVDVLAVLRCTLEGADGPGSCGQLAALGALCGPAAAVEAAGVALEGDSLPVIVVACSDDRLVHVRCGEPGCAQHHDHAAALTQ